MTIVLRFVQEKHTDKLYYMATTNALTDLANRHHLNIDLANLVEDAHARNNDLSIIALDIDYFKRLNDTYGHDAGDAVR